MEKNFKKILIFIPVSLIKLYQFIISPILGQRCRFYPSCSHYCELSFKKYGLFRGLILSLKRLLSCHPLHSGGYDPLPSKFLGKKL